MRVGQGRFSCFSLRALAPVRDLLESLNTSESGGLMQKLKRTIILFLKSAT